MTTILTYNINGIRAAIRKDFHNWLNLVGADIICLQEIKATTQQFDQNIFEDIGYKTYWKSAEKKGYSGVAILTRKTPKHIEYGCGIPEIDVEGRVIRADFDEYSVLSVYFPSGSSGDERQNYKMYFLEKISEYIRNLKTNIPNLIICGDFNICHKSIDIHNPKVNKNTSGFLPVEREWLSDFLSLGFIDSFRFYNQSPNMYTWWSYRANARRKNLGWRIDYHLVSEELIPILDNCKILSSVLHSDHCPVLLQLK
tara:strand:+ start:4411 stop:5175 length:765 start_codon:yes stop_codon:yes gene_type:complete